MKVYLLDDVKPRVLDVIPKNGFRDILDIKINNDSRYLFVCEVGESNNSAVLSNISFDDMNFNPNIKPSAYIGIP